jgi:hypothetical protein
MTLFGGLLVQLILTSIEFRVGAAFADDAMT